MKKWKTKKFTIVGWIGFGLFLLVIAIDIIFAVINEVITDWPTLSNYVSERAEDQFWFGLIVIVLMVGLIVHWFTGWFKKWILNKGESK